MSDLRYASQGDIAFFEMCIKGLPANTGKNNDGIGIDGQPLPFSCGPHSVRCLREIVKAIQPKAILEIGFNIGYSASMWLNLCHSANVTSIDISTKKETADAAAYLRWQYGNRFEFFFRDKMPLNRKYDLIFIDGGHEFDDVVTDIRLALDLKIPYIAFDDVLPEYGPGVIPAINYFKDELEHIKTMGNIALCENKSI